MKLYCRCVGLSLLSLVFAFTCAAQRSTPVQLFAASGASGDRFGNAVAVSGDTMVVGAARDDVGVNADQGSASVYRWTGTGWALEATLTAAGGLANDQFGASVAISGDTLVVGASADDVGANVDQGSAFVFVRNGTVWTQQAQLTATGGAAGDFFGGSVAISADTVVVGAGGDDVGSSANQGSAYVFVRSGTSWSQQAQLDQADGAPGDGFGVSVAISGDTLVVGAYFDDVGVNSNQGSASVFVRSGAAWSQQALLTASGGAATDLFGFSVSISGDTAVVGAAVDDVGANVDQGSAYVFVRTGTTWSQQAQLNAIGGAAGDVFGASVAISGETVVVGAYNDTVGAAATSGSATVFTRSGTTWTQQGQLSAVGGATGDQFGLPVALWGDTAVIAAPFDDVGANADQGSVWVFSRVGSTWIGPDTFVTASGGAAGDRFGNSMAIWGDTVVIGTDGDDIGANIDQGSAFIFVRAGSGWVQQAQLTALGGGTGDFFGSSVAIWGDTVVVGAQGQSASRGAAYVFVRSGGTWTQQAQLTAADGVGNDRFGNGVAISGDTVVVGAVQDTVGGNSIQGSAYVFVRTGTTWSQQTQLTKSASGAGLGFGFAVALSGDTAVVGVRQDTVDGNSAQGSAYVFVRSGTTWSRQGILTATGGAANDVFGHSVAIWGDTVVVGAPNRDVGASVDQGFACVFVRSAGVWKQQTQLIAADGLSNDHFGASVAICGDLVLVGATDARWELNGLPVGSAYLFGRSGAGWSQRTKTAGGDGSVSERFGSSVGVYGDTIAIGADNDAVSGHFDQGSALFLDLTYRDIAYIRNDSLGVEYPTLAAALLAAQSGQQISATESAWRSCGNLDSAGRSLSLWSDTDLRTPSTSTITLGGASSMHAAPGGVMEVFGQLRASTAASVDLYADSFLLGSRGILTARSNASLTIDAPVSSLQGQTRVEQGAALTFAGAAENLGPVTAGVNSTITADATITSFDTYTLTAATINAPLFYSRATFNVFGSSAIFGSFTNNNGALTTIRSGTLFVFGSLTNNGTIVGTICSTCAGEPPMLDVGGTLSLGADANLIMPYTGALVHVAGSFDAAINSNTRYDMASATLQMEGAGLEQTLEAMSTDIGANPLGLDRTSAGRYPVGTLHVGPSPSTVRVVDARDNDGQAGCEAIYVDTLVIDAGSRLNNSACSKIYYRTLVNSGVVDVPSNLVALPPPCLADINRDGTVDLLDFFAFFDCWDVAGPCAELTGDGSVDLLDFFAFFNAWDASC